METLLKRIIFVWFSVFLSFTIIAKEVKIKEAKTTAQSFIDSRFMGHSIDSITTLKKSDDQVIGYVVILKPSGFIILSNNTDIYPIISYSEKGGFNCKESENNILLHLVKWDLENRTNTLQSNSTVLSKIVTENNFVWNKYLAGKISNLKATQEIFGPLLITNWHQGGIYRDYCPIDPVSGSRSVVGCTATASAQIINYWKFPRTMHFGTDDIYTSQGDNGNILIPDDASVYDFPSFSELNNNLSSIQYNGSSTEISYLCFGVGVKHHTSYSSKGSGAIATDEFFRNLGFGSANYKSWDASSGNVISNIKNGWPVQVSIRSSSSGSRHSVVFDGYNNSDGSFHVNMGWQGTSEDTWYIPPLLDTPYNFNTMNMAVYDISPYPGWSQYAADEKNSRRTIYSIPEGNEKKWHVTCDASYSFEGLVVGRSSEIIAACNPLAHNSNYHPSIHFINEDGVKISEIVLNDEINGISHPAQSTEGKVYVTTQEGKVYLIDQESQSVTMIFQDPSNEEFMGDIKIGSDGKLYVSTWYDFYCLSATGSVIWHIDVPSNCWFVRGTPAINDSKNQIYTSYWNTVNKKSFFIVINKISGTILKTIEFDDIPYASRHLGIPSIGQNGKVYFGKRTKLFELDVNNNYSLSEIFDNGWSTITESPAIGRDGTVYISYMISGTQWAVGAINPSNKTKKWEIPFELSDYDLIREIYVDNQSNVCFTIQRENGSAPDTYTLYAYKDNGSTYTKLWDRYFNTDAGYTAFGPNNTLFVSNHNIITAISKSSQGQSFLEYTNNTPPNIPVYSYPSDGSIVDNTTVNFSWSCTDNDGHSLKYTFYIGFASQMLDVYQSNLTSSSLNISGLFKDSLYLWSVAASDGQSVTQGPIWSFKINSASEVQVISLTPNWSLVSLYVKSAGRPPSAAFGNTACGNIEVKNMSQSYNSAVPDFLNTLKTLTDGQGYFVKSTNGCTATIQDQLIGSNYSINLISGWNLVGFPQKDPSGLPGAVQSLISAGKLKQIKNMVKSYDPALPDFLNTLKCGYPGSGYFMNLSISHTGFVWQQSACLGEPKSDFVKNVDWSYTGYLQSTVFYAEITLDGVSLSSLGSIGAFVNGECRGVADIVFKDEKSYATLVVNGELPETAEFLLCFNGQIYKSPTHLKTNPGESSTNIIPIGFNSTVIEDRVQVMPNPFQNKLMIGVMTNSNDPVGISIYTIEGKLVKVINLKGEAGLRSIMWDAHGTNGQECEQGLYVIQVNMIDGIIIKRAVLVKK